MVQPERVQQASPADQSSSSEMRSRQTENGISQAAPGQAYDRHRVVFLIAQPTDSSEEAMDANDLKKNPQWRSYA